MRLGGNDVDGGFVLNSSCKNWVGGYTWRPIELKDLPKELRSPNHFVHRDIVVKAQYLVVLRAFESDEVGIIIKCG